jgi:hypothetical protein
MTILVCSETEDKDVIIGSLVHDDEGLDLGISTRCGLDVQF